MCRLSRLAALLALSSLLFASIAAAQERRIDLSPARWAEGELESFTELHRQVGHEKPAARGTKGMVAATTGALAVRAGQEVLRQGGTAADAAIATALAQVVLVGGASVSYAGVLTALYFEAKTGEVHMVFAPFAVPREEDDPLSIPGAGVPSGRTALVPGFMKGIGALHDRFGTLPLASLVEPALYFAEEGFVLSEDRLGRWIEYRRPVLSRLAATRAVFRKAGGGFVGSGDLFRQPALARTLRTLADEGVDSMYEGEWASHFVAAVQAEGGRIVARDLAEYDVDWSTPLRASYHGRDVFAPAAFGGGLILESLNLLELAAPAQYGHYSDSAEALFWLMTCSRAPYVLGMTPPAALEEQLPGFSLDDHARASEAQAKRVWEKLRRPGWLQELRGGAPGSSDDPSASGGHSAGVVAIDAEGNAVALCHSINTSLWGTTGIMVDGVSIPDAACFQQGAIAAAGPGRHVNNGMNPLLALEQGRPVLLSSTIGSGLHDATVSSVHNALDFGHNAAAVQRLPVLLMPHFELGGGDPDAMYVEHCVDPDVYRPELLERVREMGQSLFEAKGPLAARYAGYWVGITIDPKSGERVGAASSRHNGLALAQ